MKKMENTFVVTGFVGKDASIHQFSTASVARFSLAISRIEKNGEEKHTHLSLHECRGMAQEREHLVIRALGQGSTPYCRGLL